MAINPTNSKNQKATVYVDVEDEITAIIDKATAPDARIVALVLPKRAAVLQSVVNMKLLKRAAESSRKHVVLITTEAGLLPLAGAVGMYVAPSLQSRPMIPAAPDGSTEAIEEADDFDPDLVADKPIGQLAGMPAAPDDEMETIELDNGSDGANVSTAAGATTGAGLAAGTAGTSAGSAAASAGAKRNSKLNVPNFNKFRVGIILGGVLLVGLLVFGYFAVFVMPKATVRISTDSSEITTAANITLDPSARALDAEDKIFPAKIESKKITGSTQVQASGSRNKGTKATGEVKIINCSGGEDLTIPAGTGVSAEGKTYITQDALTIPTDSPTCKDLPGATSGTVDVAAITPGASFNIGAQSSFGVAGLGSKVKASSSAAMAGGTDNIVKVVNQGDIDSAKNKITSGDSAAAVKAELAATLEDAGYIAVKTSALASEPAVTPSAQVGDEADTVTVTSVVTHTMYGVKKSDVESYVQSNIKDKIDPAKQRVLTTGIDKASFDISQPAGAGKLQVAFAATSTAGPDIKADALKQQLAGKKTNDVRNIVRQTPGVTDVAVTYSPFWVSEVPGDESKVTIVIQKTNATNTSSDGNNP